MDHNDWWAFLAAAVGIAAGFQGIYERYRKDAFSGAATLPGGLYLASRGAIPALTFLLFHTSGAIQTSLWMWALVCGTGSEVLLRSNFFIKKAELPGQGAANPQSSQDIMVGPLDLLKWWQELALSWTGTDLSAKRLSFVDKHTPQAEDFQLLCKLVQARIGGLTDQAVAADLGTRIDDLCNQHAQDAAPDTRRYCFKLALLLERALPRKEFLSVISDRGEP